MTQWEYRHETIALPCYGEPVSNRINNLGRDGWEMCGYAMVDGLLDGSGKAHIFLFKRPIETEQK